MRDKVKAGAFAISIFAIESMPSTMIGTLSNCQLTNESVSSQLDLPLKARTFFIFSEIVCSSWLSEISGKKTVAVNVVVIFWWRSLVAISADWHSGEIHLVNDSPTFVQSVVFVDCGRQAVDNRAVAWVQP